MTQTCRLTFCKSNVSNKSFGNSSSLSLHSAQELINHTKYNFNRLCKRSVIHVIYRCTNSDDLQMIVEYHNVIALVGWRLNLKIKKLFKLGRFFLPILSILAKIVNCILFSPTFQSWRSIRNYLQASVEYLKFYFEFRLVYCYLK